MTLQKDDEEKDNKSIFSEGYLTYEKISLDPLKNSVQFTFHYCDGPRFNSTLQIQSYADADANQMNDIRMDQLENLFFHIGLCILPWYWMGYGCKCIRIEAGYLNPSQASRFHLTMTTNHESQLLFYRFLFGKSSIRMYLVNFCTFMDLIEIACILRCIYILEKMDDEDF
jgi:hypothetical protein